MKTKIKLTTTDTDLIERLTGLEKEGLESDLRHSEMASAQKLKLAEKTIQDLKREVAKLNIAMSSFSDPSKKDPSLLCNINNLSEENIKTLDRLDRASKVGITGDYNE